ncbi:MAG TPA: YceI family protein [Polyangiaceae bacterium]|nr:YceI family protein [Polyangiaceae bacterium]
MTILDPSSVRIHVLTYKEGLLSAVAHDLWIDVTRFTVDVNEEKNGVEVKVDASSLSVRCAMKEGEQRMDMLSAKDKRDIEKHIVEDVLVIKKHRDIRFHSRSMMAKGEGFSVSGDLEVMGKTRSISFDLMPRDREWLEATLRIHQPDFGIKPFSAMLGTLKIKPELDVVVHVSRNVWSDEPPR